MVRIRLRRVGAKKQPSFRVVVADSRAPRDGRFIENIGIYNPRTEPETLRIDEERALYWLSVGAQPSESAARLLKTNGTMARFERLKQGESMEALVAEAEEALAAEEEEVAPAELEEAVPEAEEPSVEPEMEPAEAVEEGEVEEELGTEPVETGGEAEETKEPAEAEDEEEEEGEGVEEATEE